ncbi:hypothetical protein [Candidatus Methylacidithermus pantelleriae]|uniref:Uncharacterized protein n=1 Tax=Candidatus Methylacidithermus pantelleriae TaxID=2744239 RepID=A0A8J2BR81_9BACT|nr:hypothetical protein [Candidatus Methylacidithermus pantelleriae]CAF0691336.1 hypothetical protein MPNT_100012 [Candidatus Methylacidithermus pantelleriae]
MGVLDEGRYLPPRPAVLTGAHALADPPPVADLREVVHPDPVDPASMAARTIVLLGSGFMYRMYRILSPETCRSLPSRALAAVGRKTTTQGKRAIALLAPLSAAQDFACAYEGEVLFPDIHAQHGARPRACLSSVSTTSLRYPLLSRKTRSGSFGRPQAKMRLGCSPRRSRTLLRPSIV